MAWNLRLQQLQQILKRSFAQHSTSSQQPQRAVIRVTPEVSRFDEKIHIKVQGLDPHAKVTLHALTEAEWRRSRVQFVSCGHYVSNSEGEVDLWKDASVGGTYTGVDPMGLFWSLRPSPRDPVNTRVVVKNVQKPVLYHLSLHLQHLTLQHLHPTAGVGHDSEDRREPVASTTVDRIFMSPGLRRIPVREGTVRGTLFLPPGEGPFPGVIDMFGLAGGLIETRAALLASHGFAALALPFYRHDDLPSSLEHLNFEYFDNTVSWVASHPSVRQGGIGVVGVSAGGSLATYLAYMCPQVKAVVQINSANALPTMDMYREGQLIGKGIQVDLKKAAMEDGAVVIKDAWVYDPSRLFPIWERDVHLLLLVSEDDQQMPAEASHMLYESYPPDRRHLVELVAYPGAGHLLEPPYNPYCRACYNPYFDADMLWGGNIEDHAVAQEDSWRKIRKFLHTHLAS